MAGTRIGAMKVAAKIIGISFEEYLENNLAGLKWCTEGKHWQLIGNFTKDSSRSDGLETTCRDCRSRQSRPGPKAWERKMMRARGFAWCRNCETWLTIASVHMGLCQKCTNEYMRGLYARSKPFREKRKQYREQRQRGVDRVPLEGQEILLEDFDNKCAYCGGPTETWDHIVPVSRGGKTTPGNVVPACLSCNSSKSNKDVFEWLDQRGFEANPALIERIELAISGWG